MTAELRTLGGGLGDQSSSGIVVLKTLCSVLLFLTLAEAAVEQSKSIG